MVESSRLIFHRNERTASAVVCAYAQKRLRILHELFHDHHKQLPTSLRVSDLMTEEVKKSPPSAMVAKLRRLTTTDVVMMLPCAMLAMKQMVLDLRISPRATAP